MPTSLSAEEQAVCSSLMRILVALPRVLDDDLVRGAGLSSTEYAVLMHLSEAPGRRLRMSDLAARAALSRSRISRVVDGLAAAGLVHRLGDSKDGRCTLAELTDAGLARLTQAWPHHLASVRANVLDVLGPAELAVLAVALPRLASELKGCGAPPTSCEP